MACATSRTLAKVNSSLMTARQPSVPNLIAIGIVPRRDVPRLLGRRAELRMGRLSPSARRCRSTAPRPSRAPARSAGLARRSLR